MTSWAVGYRYVVSNRAILPLLAVRCPPTSVVPHLVHGSVWPRLRTWKRRCFGFESGLRVPAQQSLGDGPFRSGAINPAAAANKHLEFAIADADSIIAASVGTERVW